MLSNSDIELLIIEGSLRIVSKESVTFRPGSICLHLASEVMVFDLPCQPVDLLNASTYPRLVSKKICDVDGYVLNPGGFLLAGTVEKVGLSEDVGGQLSNLSGLARLGLNVLLSTHVAPGFGSKEPKAFTLEIHNVSPFSLILKPGMRICHLILHRMNSSASVGYDELMVDKYTSGAPSGSEYTG
jgi:dCTP deaminase